MLFMCRCLDSPEDDVRFPTTGGTCDCVSARSHSMVLCKNTYSWLLSHLSSLQVAFWPTLFHCSNRNPKIEVGSIFMGYYCFYIAFIDKAGIDKHYNAMFGLQHDMKAEKLALK